MDNVIYNKVYKEVAKVRRYMENKYNSKNLEGKSMEAIMHTANALEAIGINSSIHIGWCIYDFIPGTTGERFEPHAYVLAHVGKQRLYVDIAAAQLSSCMNVLVPDVIVSEVKPTWLKSNKPSIKR